MGNKEVPQETSVEIRQYSRRWIILFIFSVYSVTVSFHWIQYSSIADIVVEYYNVPSTVVDWTSIIFMVIFIPLIFPASYFLDTMSTSSMGNKEVPQETSVKETRLYSRRWIILFIFSVFSTTSSFQWIQYSSIADIVVEYYNVPSTAVDWTSIIFMVTFIPFIFPASYFLDTMGLRSSILLGTLGTALGACIKTLSVPRHLFWVTFLGQTLVAMSQVFMLSIPPVLAAIWFGAHEVSTACSIGIFGNQLGIALGFLVPPLVVKKHDDMDKVGQEMEMLYYVNAGVCTIIFLMAYFFFQKAPPLPPSIQQAAPKQPPAGPKAVWALTKRLFNNYSYVLLCGAYAINQGAFNAVCTMLSQMVLRYFPGGDEFAGRVGLVMVFAGMAGSILFGVLLDKTRAFRLITLAVMALSLLAMLVFTYTLALKSEATVYVTSGAVGMFLAGYMPIAYDLAVEVTYPEPEGLTSGILTVGVQVGSTIMTNVYSWLLGKVGDVWANNVLSATLLVGTILHILLKPDLRRQAVGKNPPV